MSDLLPWTTRGVTFESRRYLATVDIKATHSIGPIDADTPFTVAMRELTRLRGSRGGMIEYGCFSRDGTLIEDQGLLIGRQIRNILYYTIRDLFNLSWQAQGGRFSPGAPIDNDPVPEASEGRWGVLLSERCPDRAGVTEALAPLVRHRDGRVVVMPAAQPDAFLPWLQEQFNTGTLPPYLMICDTFEHIPLEYQFILNAFAATGRLWLDSPQATGSYVRKVLDVERGALVPGPRRVVATPMDDPVTAADYLGIISEVVPGLTGASGPLDVLAGGDFGEDTLLAAAGDAGLVAVYCHGVALDEAAQARYPDLQGAFVLQFGAKDDQDLLRPDDLRGRPFAPGGIVFSPACLAGGTQANSDYAAWIDPRNLPPYLGSTTQASALSRALLASPDGPAALVMHFDISMGNSAPMYNPLTGDHDLQRDLHGRFLGRVLQGDTIGRATGPFRWAAGAYYAQAIYVFGQIAGHTPYIGTSGRRKTIGNFVDSMNMYHVTATDMRNYIILGDPAVRLRTA
ncbi:MAG: hypothetical protein QN178_12915 [Armatimonadota bacterium]|nr:hypothetical protein [Armatimonadota bacterium]